MREVQLYVWDLANAPGPDFDWARTGKSYAYKTYHSSVVVFNEEYSFSKDGVCTIADVVSLDIFMLLCPLSSFSIYCEQRESIRRYGAPLMIEYMGCTHWTEHMLMYYIKRREYTPATYDLIHFNCNSFSADLLKFLVNKTLPDFLLEAARENKRGWLPWLSSKLQAFGSGSTQVHRSKVSRLTLSQNQMRSLQQ